MNKLLWLDDIRNPFLNTEGKVPCNANGDPYIIEWVLDYGQFVAWIEKFGLPDAISFDHDLGDTEISGMDCAKWLVDYCMDRKKALPKIYVHSANPVGADNIRGLLSNFSGWQKQQGGTIAERIAEYLINGNTYILMPKYWLVKKFPDMDIDSILFSGLVSELNVLLKDDGKARLIYCFGDSNGDENFVNEDEIGEYLDEDGKVVCPIIGETIDTSIFEYLEYEPNKQ